MINELSRDNPRLKELEAAYANLNLFDQSLWRTFADGIDIQNFRGEPGYLAQMWSMTPEHYQRTYDYALEIGEEETIARLGEDGEFGAIVFQSYDGVAYSRDLLDSVFELRFLRQTIGLQASVLDIGPGYGRLLHRLAQVQPAGGYFGIDAIPLSTFLCDFYLRFRQCSDQTLTIPLHRHADFHAADMASNIYSFSEMPLSAIRFWLSYCADRNIRHFFLVPHAGDLVHPHFVTSEPDGSHLNYLPEFEKHGYRIIRQEPKFPYDRAAGMVFGTDFIMFERHS